MEEHVLSSAQESPGDRSPCERRFYSEFAGILQGELRHQGSGGPMLLSVCGAAARQKTYGCPLGADVTNKWLDNLPATGHMMYDHKVARSPNRVLV